MRQMKADFLHRLKWSLILYLPCDEVQPVLEDYSAFFDDRLADGKTEREVWQEFGSPRTVAGNILRESGRRALPLGLLVLVWTALAAFLNWWFTWWEFSHHSAYPLLYLLQLALFPLLYFFWRNALSNSHTLPSKRWAAVLWGGGAATWAVPFGYILWMLLVEVPRWTLPLPEAQAAGMGTHAAALSNSMGCVLLLLIFLALLRCWLTGNSNYLPAAAWCLGLRCSLNRQLAVLQIMDVEAPLAAVQTACWRTPLIVLAVVGAGGAALMSLLLRKGGRHGRTT